MLDVLLDEVVLVLGDGDVEAAARDEPSLAERVLVGVAKRDELVVGGEIRKRETAGDRQELGGDRANGAELLSEDLQVGLRRGLVEAADPDVDGVDLAAADERHDLVPHLLQGEALGDELRVVLGHVDRALVPEEVGGVEHRDVQHVALDPLAAVEEAAQLAEGASHRHATGRFHRVDRAHLVGDGADAADAGRDVGRLGEFPAPQEGLEEARRLVDVEARLDDLVALDLDVEATFPLDPGQRADGDRPRGPLRLRSRRRCGRGLPGRSLLRRGLHATFAHGSRSPAGTARHPR